MVSPVLKDAVRQVIPPAAMPVARWLMINVGRRAPEWEFVARTWPEGDRRLDGWQHPSVAAAQKRRWADFVGAVRSTRPLGVEHEAAAITSESLPGQTAFLAFLYALARAAGTRGRASVLDWGGGLGYYAVVARTAMPEITLDYTVQELPEVSGLGQELLPQIRFSSDDETCLGRRYDLVFVSGSLQYAQDWRDQLRRLAASTDGWLFITRLPVVEDTDSFVVVQRPHRVGYETEYISWVLNRRQVVAEAEAAGLVLEREFILRENLSLVAGAPEQYRDRGLLFRRPSPPAPGAIMQGDT